ncbi:MAG: EamA family transporter [Candidatus Micrarchaeaceae archaeon]
MEAKLRNVLLILLSTLLGAAGQLFFKYSFQSSEFILILFLGLVAYFTSTLIYFYVLSRTHLSWAYSLGGLAYIFAVIFADLVLNENIPLLRWIGVGVIFVGVVLIGTT